MPVLMHSNVTTVWKVRFRIMAVQMDNLRGLLGIKRMDKIPNVQIRELHGVMKGFM